METKYNGIIEDQRSKEEQNKDFKHEELFGAPSVDWLTKKQAALSLELYPERNQKSTSACVCYAVVTALYDTEKEILSPGFLYTQRYNKPSEGSNYHDIASIVMQHGVPLESELSTPLKELEINKLSITEPIKKLAAKHKQKNYVFIDNPSLEILAELSNKGIPVVLSIFGTSKEWGKVFPTVDDFKLELKDATVHHAITILPNSAYKDMGRGYVIIQDSAHFGGQVFRHLDNNWISKRAKHAMYFIDLEKEEYKDKVSFSYEFKRDLFVGLKGEDVMHLQKALQELGFFPKDVDLTGNFFGITRQAVKDFQKKYDIKPIEGYFGIKSRTKMKEFMSS